ncbi:hypothetical protein GCM10025873_25430 [Demequina sediminis]|nr:hypothetical protein GCM10025873_25430 [Demequina sediminis]
MTYDESTLAGLTADAAQIMGRYPVKRSALLPMLHLVQSVDGYVSPDGIQFCADQLELTAAEVSAVATFYTQYKRRPNGEYQVGVCTNTLCAVMGGDRIWDELSEHVGVGHDETTEDGTITLERLECNAACDYAPVMMVNWEFFDNQTPESAKQVVDDLRAGKDVAPTRGPAKVCSFKEVSRVLAGFEDGRADEDQGSARRPSPVSRPRRPRAGRREPSDRARSRPQRHVGCREVLEHRHVHRRRRLRGAEDRARHGSDRHRAGREGLGPARSWRRRLPDRNEVGLPAAG